MQVMVPPHGIYPPDYGLGAQRYRGDTFPPGIIGRWNTLCHFYSTFYAGFGNQTCKRKIQILGIKTTPVKWQ